MVDTALCTLFNWEPARADMNVTEEKAEAEGSALSTKQNHFNYYLGSSGESDTTKSSTPTSDVTSKSPKPEITLNSLQHEQNTLIQQRIQDRASSLRNMGTPVTLAWPGYNTFNRSFSNLGDANSVAAGNCLTNPITACMFTSNRTVQWFGRPLNNDPWSNEYPQDPTMRSRPCFSSHQTRELEREFLICQYVTRRRRIELAYTLNLTEKQIKTWFQNRRVKERKQKKTTGETRDIEQPSS